MPLTVVGSEKLPLSFPFCGGSLEASSDSTFLLPAEAFAPCFAVRDAPVLTRVEFTMVSHSCSASLGTTPRLACPDAGIDPCLER
jgi:hypothetical protein